VSPGLFEYVTVYTREPNFHSDGSSLTNVNTATEAQLRTFFQNASVGNASGLASSIGNYTHPRTGRANTFPGILNFCLFCRNQGVSSADFARIYNSITTSTNAYIRGRVNINTASAAVLESLFMGAGIDESTASGAAQSLVTYRQQNPNNLTSIAWLIDALGNSSTVVQALVSRDYITTHSFQFTTDIAAVGPFGRGYRRVKFIFDVSDGTPKILYRQDLSRLGWALGGKVRETQVAKATQ
jgi:DNA uptake protein ComE-like DNA-binding protein